MLRKIIIIDNDKCDGCGNCIPSCHEGALQIIDGKARLISDLFCDGLGACIGECPQNAIQIVEREAEPYNETLVIEAISKNGKNVINAHLKHLADHSEWKYLNEAKLFLEENGFEFDLPELSKEHSSIKNNKFDFQPTSELENWPIQMHLINPEAGYFQNADLLLAADCCGFASPNFHNKFLTNKKLIIACPKLDSNKQVYYQKLITLFTEVKIKSITVLIMQVPCCGGLASLVIKAAQDSEVSIPIEIAVLNVKGEIIKKTQFISTEINN